MKLRNILALLAGIVLAGCGTDQGGTLSCPNPGLTGCDSLSEVYERTVGNYTDHQPAQIRKLRNIEVANPPNLDPPRVIKVWIAPWEDEDGDLHDYQYLYLIIEQPSWNLDHWQANKAN